MPRRDGFSGGAADVRRQSIAPRGQFTAEIGLQTGGERYFRHPEARAFQRASKDERPRSPGRRPSRAASRPPQGDGKNSGVFTPVQTQITFPGFNIPFGSSRRLRLFIRSSATVSFTVGNRSRFITPTPCSAEIEPPYFFTTAKTVALTSSQRLRNSTLSAPAG